MLSRTVTFHRTGGPEVLEITPMTVAAPAAGEVQIQVQAIGINRAEVMYRSGQYVIAPQYPAKLGYEAAGIITAVGADIDGFAPGDSVSVIPAFMFSDYGMYGEIVNAPAHAVVKHPQNLSFVEAAASWMMFVTAYGALVEFGKLQAGQYVAIGAASSSVGIAAIQIATMLGAHPIALSRSSDKRELLINAGAEAVIATAEQDVTAELGRLTQKKGVNIVFDPVGGPDSAKLAAAMSMHGLFFQYGALDSRDLSIPVMDILGKHLTFRGYELFEITTDRDKMARAKAFVYQGLQSGALKPIIDKVFAFDDIAMAHRYMEANAQVGKIVVSCASKQSTS
ncbi:zinc-dependent alcohol dehydrogenase family protein [Klebsiella aerogenes]|uniref:zinc-dependent alcohol dehydrogenase family protein n=1 Tax=Klebsiella aerogenes TaxID=548 RepID=UPI001C8B71A7|nr:zinc-dependent alcohol dehydrogenase family protein [Klebsiella aerogenes]MBX8998095.1 zinc-dependent alcohol dehydrogenase family protein [Klebsiella aerogenes]HBU8521972.1 zinc-dependent alcohol dehydrogenase family protein [Klebsiella aerogenes]HBV9943804.1 zinc-dependent alcohol dehydrogenase family protein [Klebsiella aerogenes]HDS5322372.1 zinc-dependent alcohol dehydrogenase family protein [Klebsiella aerogenes]HEP1063072.1 zinc-dependent alcohol dehydrogenase family protein [Klebsie